MDKLLIEGGPALRGRVDVSGSKNGALPILLGCLLVPGEVTLNTVPRLKDIDTTLSLLGLLGAEAALDDGVVRIDSTRDPRAEAPYDLVRTMRASVLCLGPLLARLGRARVALPGGCAIGTRPVDMHLTALEKMGVTFDLDSGYIDGRCDRLRGAHIAFDFPTVGGTENLLMAAVLAEGETVLENAAREPEIADLANFLNACGARIRGQGTSIIRVQGVDSLHGTEYTVLPDRIEAGTFMAAAAITGGELEIGNCPTHALDSVISKLREIGADIRSTGENEVTVAANGPLQGIDVVTQPYPGFPTDMQAQIMALMCVAQGAGSIRETIFENRFMHAMELKRMGAAIRLTGDTALIRGGRSLVGAQVMASDLRASASLVLAALAAEGTTEVRRIYHLDRGYETMDRKLTRIGARIRRARE
jgi:UDP-N-acetylglucosamine 1-carboxyvinyltransferase